MIRLFKDYNLKIIYFTLCCVIAATLISDSVTFLKELFTYITHEVDELNKEHGIETEKANWLLVLHVVCEIFSELHKICQYAVEGEPVIQI